jgi:hypothetical protein
MRRRRLLTPELREGTGELIQQVARLALPLGGPADLDPLLERIGDTQWGRGMVGAGVPGGGVAGPAVFELESWRQAGTGVGS